MPNPLLIAVLGPTASGKSQLAFGLASALDGEIVNCDSMQLIRGMDIGTAKPSILERNALPHHLYDLIEPDQVYSAGKYMLAARHVCREISGRGRTPMVVGGTGLYLRALLEGLFTGPGRDQRLRHRLTRIGERRGPAVLHRLLRKVDPVASEKVHPSDVNRMVRSLEVFYQRGRPISQLHDLRQPLQGYRVLKIGLRIARQDLCDRIERRVGEMFRTGLLHEVETLLRQGYSPQTKGFEAIGYRYAASHLAGLMTLQEAVERTCADTRRYAKRQKTWFRKESDVFWIDSAGEEPGALQKAMAIVAASTGDVSAEKTVRESGND